MVIITETGKKTTKKIIETAINKYVRANVLFNNTCKYNPTSFL